MNDNIVGNSENREYILRDDINDKSGTAINYCPYYKPTSSLNERIVCNYNMCNYCNIFKYCVIQTKR